MKQFNRKLLSGLLALLMVLSLLPVVFTPKTAVAATATPLEQMQGGAILHCFNWSYNEIREALPDIKAAGYIAVQTSPVQQAKDYDASYMDSKGQWWKLYQPLGLKIAPDVDGVPTSFLGTKAELTALCDEAEDLGIYVIVDIVANHLANKSGGGYYLNGEVNLSEQVDEEYQNHPEYFHANTDGVNDDSRYNMTQNQMGMPDLNTSNEFIQEQVYGLLKECVDCGVDGFRFDAAKHIELPGDSDCGSDFWSAVLNGSDTDGGIMGIRKYAGAENLFIYGESLSGNAGETWVDEFITYMALTDSNYGGRIRDAINGTNAGMLGDGSYVRCSTPSGNVVWVESHDTFEDGASSGIESDKIVKAWAIVGARADSTALYLARPNEIMGKASSDTTWKSPAVAAVNAFKNRYDGTREYLHQNYDNKVAWIEREGDAYKYPGVVISKLDGAGAVSLELEWMVDGYYEDELTGNVFTVSNHVITGNVGPTGVAVVYHEADNPNYIITANKIYFVPTGWWTNDNAWFGMYLFNDCGGEAFVSLEDEDGDGVYEGKVPDPEFGEHWEYVSFMRMNPDYRFFSWETGAIWDQVANLVNDPGTNCFTISAPEGSSEATGTWSYCGPITADPIYFVPTGWWTNDNARFEMWLFNDDGGTFVSLTDADNDGTYEGALPEGDWTGVIFVRMDPNGTEHTWDSKWNQTENLVPDAGTNCFTITAGTSDGTWSVYDGTPNPDAGYYLVGTMTGWAVLPEYKMTRTGASTEEYMFENVELIRTSSYHSQVKAVYSPDGVTKQTWYPDGFDNNYGDYDGEIPVSGVYTIYFRPNYDGGDDWHDNCIYAEQTKYYVAVSDADKNGVVTVDKDTAAVGDTVNVTVTPHEGYELDTLVYRYETAPNTMEFETVEIEGNSFTMPAYNVTVIATFKEVVPFVPTFEVQNLVLSGKIGVNFYMDLSGLTDEEKAASYMAFEISGKGEVNERDNFDEKDLNQTGAYYGFTCYVSSIQMADTITATFHYGEDKRIEKTYSVKEYIEAFDKSQSSYDATTVALVHAMADYGYYAQQFLSARNGWTIGEDYAEFDKCYTDSYSTSATDLDSYKFSKETTSDIAAVTYSLVMDSDTSIRVFFRPATGYDGTFKVTVKDADGEIILNQEEVQLNNGRYLVSIDGISAHRLSQKFTVTATTVAGDSTVTVCALSYARSMLANYAGTADATAAAALYAYSLAANAYKTAHPNN